MLGLLAIAIVVTGGASVTLLRSYLVERVDTQLADASRMAANDLSRGHDFEGDGHPPPGSPTADYFVQANDADGTVIDAQPTDTESAPDLPELDKSAVSSLSGDAYTVDSVSGADQWRVVTAALPDGNSVTVALSLEEVQSTTDRLMLITGVVGGAALLLLAVRRLPPGPVEPTPAGRGRAYGRGHRRRRPVAPRTGG